MDELAIAKYIELGEILCNPPTLKISARQEYWQGRSVLLEESQKKDIAVICDNGNYSLWPASRFGNGVFVAKYVGGADNDKG